MSSTLLRRALTSTLVVLALLLALAIPATPAAAMTGTITGKVMDSVTHLPIQSVDLYLGIPGAFVWARTAVDGSFSIDLTPVTYNPSTPWQVYFVKPGYVTVPTNKFFMTSSGYVFGSDPTNVPNPFPLVKQLIGPRSSCTDPGTGNPNPPAVTSTVYLPNITRRLGGPNGFYTPFIIQNTGTVNTELEISFYKFTDGSCVERYLVFNVAPGTSHSNDPNDTVKNPSLPDDAQFSVVVQSFGSKIVGVVNEHQNVLDPVRAEALSYDGFTSGANTVYLPNITRKFFGLFDTPFIIQNLGSSTASVTASFKTFDGTGPTIVIPRTIDPGRAKPIDPRVSFSTQATTHTPCTTGGADCLADGEYNIKIEAVGGTIAAQVNVSSAATGMGYSATASPATKFFLPNLTKSLCFCPTPTQNTGWSTPILLQSVTATTVTVSWYNFLGGSLAFTHTVNLTAGGGVRIDPWSFSQLAADRQYSVVVDGGTGTVTAIVSEFASGGDNAMMYEGFAAVP